MEISHKLIIGPTLSGKSYLCKYLMENNLLYSSGVHHDNDGAAQVVEYILVTDLAKEIKKKKIPCEYNIPLKNITDNLDNNTMKIIKNYFSKSKPVVIICDDLNKLIDVNNANNKDEMTKIKQSKSNLNFIFSEGRHLGIYCVALVQYYKVLPPLIRNNSRYHIIVFGSNVTCETLFEHVSHYFNSKDELKQFITDENIDHTSICFDIHNNSREKKDNIMLIAPNS